ncbi:AAA family ATPase [Paraburkholderia sp.]|uniref:AAA family ATPase n=1 Tax=Paraburkholderia sp. TaxID=1926495 RepID=UPI00238516EA|nr:AAA family ATPase [Paraburkholderia sp.]MDE1184604.1 AAA family ATPase [Paraburkholderia sp.]
MSTPVQAGFDIELNLPAFPAPADFSMALAEGFARRIGMLARRSGASPASIRWAARAAFAASRATAEGHVCVPLPVLALRYDAAAAEVRRALFDSGVACDGTQAASALRPLVVDGQGRLYLARYYDYERRLARSLVAHAGAVSAAEGSDAHRAASADVLHARLLRYFGEPRDAEVDWQRVAAVMALSGRLTIVSGGPGTGKTTTVVGVLACLLDSRADLRIALAAPTGKAAQRMQEALLARAGDLPPELANSLPQTSYTLHRLLGSGPNGRYRHHRDNPLPYDVIVIDEASMIDVAMAAHLLDAVAPHTRLVMLGDKDQLAAVEAGAVFAELSAQPRFSTAGVDAIAAALQIDPQQFSAALPRADAPQDDGDIVDEFDGFAGFGGDDAFAGFDRADDAGAGGAERFAGDFGGADASDLADGDARAHAKAGANTDTPLADCVVWLERNYRFGLDSAIGRLSLAIRRGAATEALDTLDIDPSAPCAAALYEDTQASPGERTVARLAAGFAPYADALADALASDSPDPLPLFDALNRFRILCATRAGQRGVDQVNATMSAQVRRAARVPLAVGAQWFPGRPVMVTRNDYALGLFNGDIGIALPGADGALRVYFRTGDGGMRAVSPAALPPHDTAFALTVHKSQGSEFEHAVLMLPSSFSRVLSRELVYTAITRARTRVEVIGARAVFAQAVATPTQRDSGLAARIAEMARPAPATARSAARRTR